MTFVLAAAIVAILTARALFFHAGTRQGRFGGRRDRVGSVERRSAVARSDAVGVHAIRETAS